MGNPRVSVIIPVRNSARTLARAIDSALDQRYAHEFEVIVVNDGSTDATPALIQSYGDRIVALHRPGRGVAAARNAGAHIARGPYLAFLDADDHWTQDKLARVMPLLQAAPEYVLAYHDAIETDLAGSVQRTSYYNEDYRPPSLAELLTPQGHACHILPSAVIMRRSVFDQCGGFDETLTASEDFYMWIRAREHGPFLFIPECLTYREFAPSPEREVWYLAGARDLERALSQRYASVKKHDFLFAALLWCSGAAFRRGDYRASISRSLAAIAIHPAKGFFTVAGKSWRRISAYLTPPWRPGTPSSPPST
jgi:glycosyltransferase involved in cell wall biosynthesis